MLNIVISKCVAFSDGILVEGVSALYGSVKLSSRDAICLWEGIRYVLYGLR